jgi:hypothetical protein
MQGGHLPRRVVRRRHLDDVESRERDARQRAQVPERLARLQPGHLGRAGAWCERRIQHVDVERQVRGSAAQSRAHSLAVLRRRHRHELVAGDHLKAHFARLAHVGRAIERTPHAGEGGARGIEQPLLHGAPERGPVEVALAVVLIPGVGVRVEQNERNRTVHGGLSSQLAEHDRVIAAKHERHSARAQHRPQRRVDLLGGAQRVSRRHIDVAAVDQRQRPEDVHVEAGVIRAKQGRGGANRLGTEARARPEARRCVERHADDRRVHAVVGERDVREPRECADTGIARRATGIGRGEPRFAHGHLADITSATTPRGGATGRATGARVSAGG